MFRAEVLSEVLQKRKERVARKLQDASDPDHSLLQDHWSDG